jgi:2-keto-3-deoxy-L-rhamnonate aldolase RhmA
MRTNKTKAKLRAGEPCFGAVIRDPSPELVELLGAVGFDFVTLDVEHEPMDGREITNMIRAAEAFDVTPIIRLPLEPDRILVCLDVGAQAIHVPRCNSAEDAQALVDACRFHPQGKRTFYARGRSANYSLGVDIGEWSQAANRELLVIAMVEELEGMKNLDDILAVEHLDAIHIGPQDLWQSMGMPSNDVVDAAVEEILERTVATGRHVSLSLGLKAETPAEIAGYIERGVRMITLSPRDFITQGATKLLNQVRSSAQRAG